MVLSILVLDVLLLVTKFVAVMVHACCLLQHVTLIQLFHVLPHGHNVLVVYVSLTIQLIAVIQHMVVHWSVKFVVQTLVHVFTI
jgi:hypothetical protein